MRSRARRPLFPKRLAAPSIAAALLLALPGCSPRTATASAGTTSAEPLSVVRRGEFQPKVLLTGELEAVNAEPISIPRTPAWQVPIRWLETDGTEVVAGQKVVELDNSQFTGDLEQRRLAEAGAYNELAREEAQIGVTLSEKEFAVAERRIELEKAKLDAGVPAELRSRREHQEKQLEMVRAEYEHRKAVEDLSSSRQASEAEIEQLRIALERAEQEIRTAEEAIATLSLTAPGDGILVISENRGEGRKYQVGDSVWVGLQVARIPDLSQMNVVARLIDVDDGRIAPGMRALCRLDTYPEREFPGHVIEIAPVAQEDDDQSLRRSFRVVIRLDDSDPERMRPGMSVRAEVLPLPLTDAIVVPRFALEFDDEGTRALMANGSSVEVTLGQCNALECVVREGLEDGVRLRAGS